MTTINALVLDSGFAAMAADEMSSNAYRDGYRTDKIRDISTDNFPALSGASGPSTLCKQVYEDLPEETQTTKQLASTLAHNWSALKHEFIRGVLCGKYNLPESVFSGGILTLPNTSSEYNSNVQQIQQEYNQMINLDSNHPATPNVNGRTLTVGVSPRPEIYVTGPISASPTKVTKGYHAIGSGSDLSDASFSEFFRLQSQKDQSKLSPKEGIVALLRATNKSMANSGVGGRVRLGHIHDSQTSLLNAYNSEYAALAVHAHDVQALPKRDMLRFVDQLVFKDADYREVREELGQKTAARKVQLAEIANR